KRELNVCHRRCISVYEVMKLSLLAESLRKNDRRAVDCVIFYSLKGFIGLGERERSHFRTQFDLGGKMQKVACVGASHVRDTADLAFSPQQSVIVEFRHAVEVNRVDR